MDATSAISSYEEERVDKDKGTKDGGKEEREHDSEIKSTPLEEKITIQRNELLVKDAVIAEMNDEIASLRKETEDNKKTIGDLNREIKNKNEITNP